MKKQITGGAAIYGQGVKNAAEIAVAEINAAGGINGYQVEFMWGDDEHDAEKAVNAYNDLKDQGMQMLLGTVTSTPCIAVADKTFADNMFMLTAQLIGDKAIVVVAGDPECRPALEEQGINHYIHVKCNVLDTLKEYQKALGVKEL